MVMVVVLVTKIALTIMHTNSKVCDCGEMHTILHIVNSSLTKFDSSYHLCLICTLA